jgi:hypothetical protein
VTAEAAAVTAAVLALSGTIAASLLQARANRRQAHIGELRRRTADAFAQAFVVQHAMEWITWYAKNDPEALDSEMKRQYAEDVHRAFPALLGAMAATAALSMDVYDGLRPILDELYGLEERVALALRSVDTQGRPRAEAIDSLIALHGDSLRLLRELPESLSSVMKVADEAST